MGRRIERKPATPPAGKTASKKQIYGRLLIYPIIIALFIIATRKMQQRADWVGKSSAYQFHFIQDTHALQDNYDVKSYHLNLELQLDYQEKLLQANLKGANQIVFKASKSGVKEITLNFSTLMQVDSISGGDGYKHKENLLKVKLPEALQENQLDTVTVYYQGWPKKYHSWSYGFGISYTLNKDSLYVPWLTTMNPPFGAQTWMPCKDDPADKADSLIVTVKAPSEFSVFSNGRLRAIKHLNGNRKQTVWVEKYPIATYLIHLNIGQLEIAEEAYLNNYGNNFNIGLLSPDLANTGAEIVHTQLNYMLGFLEKKIAPYPFPESKLYISEFPGQGGMENQDMIAVERLGPTNERLIMHELAHQWFGASATPDNFSDIWITEGLCNYLTALYLKEYKNISAFKAYLNEYRYAGSGLLRIRATNHPDSVYNINTTYRKATWFFYMLHEMLGEDLFWETISAFYRVHAYQTFNYSDFKSFVINYSGKDLSYFFDQWVNEREVPDLLIKIIPKESIRQNMVRYQLTLKQKQPSHRPFQFPLQILLVGEKHQKMVNILIRERTTIRELNLPFYIEDVRLDPDKKILFTYELLR
ncbi:MAG: M1 family metallopeptidase [Calditrichia bacterium]